jgi:ribosomal protein L34E
MFMMNCNNKGCGKYQPPTLNKTDNEVYCSECGKIISGVSHFTKTQLKSLGQTKKPTKTAFAVRCDKCKTEALPKIDQNKLVCVQCGTECANISKPFEIMIRAAIKKGNEEL